MTDTQWIIFTVIASNAFCLWAGICMMWWYQRLQRQDLDKEFYKHLREQLHWFRAKAHVMKEDSCSDSRDVAYYEGCRDGILVGIDCVSQSLDSPIPYWAKSTREEAMQEAK